MDRLTRFAWVFGVLGLLGLIASFSYWVLFRETDPVWTGLLVGTGVLLSAYVFLDWQRVEYGLQSRAFRYGSGAVLLTFLAGLSAVVLYMLAERHDETWDLTREGQFTLSDQSRSVLAGLQTDVAIYGFFRADSGPSRAFEDLAERMRQESSHVRVELVDPLREPFLAEQFRIEGDRGTIVLVAGEERERLETEFGEEAVINALIRLTSGEDHRICWSVGHGELDPDDDMEAEGMGTVVVALEDQNYTVTKSPIFTEGVDRGCEALVVAGPQHDLAPHEREAIAAYVAEGGRVVMLLEPDSVPDLAAELERYGVRVGNDVVLEDNPSAQLMGLDPSYVVLSEDLESFGFHPIVQPLRSLVVLGIARSVAPIEGAPGVSVTQLAKTTDRAWAETNLDPNAAELQPDPGVDLIGDVPLAVAVEVTDPAGLEVGAPADTDAGGSPLPGRGSGIPTDFAPKAGGRLVVIGDYDFATNGLIALGNNRDLFMNTIAWLVDEEEQLGERAAEDDERFTMTELQAIGMMLVSVLFVPLAAVAAAVAVLLRRRFL